MLVNLIKPGAVFGQQKLNPIPCFPNLDDKGSSLLLHTISLSLSLSQYKVKGIESSANPPRPALLTWKANHLAMPIADAESLTAGRSRPRMNNPSPTAIGPLMRPWTFK